MRYMPTNTADQAKTVERIRIWYMLLILVCAVFVIRLFYLQVIRHDYYRQEALLRQHKEYEIPAERGIIEAHDGDAVVPLVLNQKLYTLYADPKFIKDPAKNAGQVASIVGGDASKYEQAMQQKTRYVVLAKKITEDQKNKILSLKNPGLNTEEHSYRIYPEGQLGAPVLGFVNDDGVGKYGVEQALNDELTGTPGQLKAITDAAGVPLVANKDNVVTQPVAGNRTVLTIDITMQRKLEEILKKGLENAHSDSGSAVIMDPKTGAIKAMASYPTYNPTEYSKVEDPKVFNNLAVSDPLEVGSIMKILTLAAGLNEGVITPTTTYYDSGQVTIDGATIKNVLSLSSHDIQIPDILRLSLNTGAVHVFTALGGGNSINEKARTTWYKYMTDHYQLGKPTGIEQGYEGAGSIPDPIKGDSRDLQYANTAFGQGMNATILQMAAAASAILNGGTYYKPHLVDSTIAPSGSITANKPQIVKTNVVSPEVSAQMRQLMKYVFDNNHVIYQSQAHPGYNIGAKTGTAQFVTPEGGYAKDIYNGTFMGYVGGDMPDYVITILVNAPKFSSSADSAGTQGAAPIFGQIENLLINNYGIKPATH